VLRACEIAIQLIGVNAQRLIQLALHRAAAVYDKCLTVNQAVLLAYE